MQGNGFFIWQLETINDYYNPEQLAQLLKQARVNWVSWKLAEGIYRYNQVGGNDQMLIAYMQALEAVGIVSGGWSYNYPEKPGTQSGVIAERVAKFSNNLDHFDHWMLDIESEWKKPNLGGAIDSLLYIDINRNFPVGFCSYRYPELHAPLNFPRFLKNPTVKFNAPQVYWIGAHDVTAQLDRSFAQYANITFKPFIPIGAAFGAGGWLPTTDDLTTFVSYCKSKGWDTFGWWSLDWVLRRNRLDWLAAIGGSTITQPIPQVKTHVVTKNVCNPRNAPDISPQADAGTFIKGIQFEKAGAMVGDFQPVKVYLHKSTIEEV